jgi:hypothetical protein
MSYEDDMMRRVNYANAAAGNPVSMPEEWEAINAMAEAVGEFDGIELPLDRNEIAQRIAADLVRTCTSMWARRGERTVDTRFCPEYDDSKVETMSRLYALTYADIPAYPLSDPSQYKQVAAELIGDIGGCWPPVTKDCDKTPLKYVAVKRGDYLCLCKLCVTCRKAMETLTVDSPDYIGPPEWVDDRTWKPDPFELQYKNPWTTQLSDWEPPKPPPDDDPWSL